jgi:quinol monooxygenase YgiN
MDPLQLTDVRLTTQCHNEDTKPTHREELFIFARLHAKEGCAAAVAAALQDVVIPTRAEDGCIGIQAFGSIRDQRLFYIHSRWTNEAAFDFHATMPHTLRFVAQIESLLEHPLDVTRARPLS